MLKPPALSSCCSVMLPCYAFFPPYSSDNFPFLFYPCLFLLLLPFFPVSSVLICGLYPFLWLWHLPVNLSQSLQVSVCTYISTVCSSLHGLNRLIYFALISLCSGQPLTLTAEKSELSTHLPLLHECGLLALSWSISVSVVWLRCLHRTVRQGWEKWFPVGVWGPGPFLSSRLSGVLSGQGISPLWLTPEMGF